MEQEVPELGRTTRVIADIRAQEGPTAPTRYADVMVTHYAYQQHGEWKGSEAGRAVRDAEICKWIKYRPEEGVGTAVLLVPLCFETGGRWGKQAMYGLRRLARVKAQIGLARQAADKDAVYRATLLRWRRESSCALQQGNAAILMAATGQTSSVLEVNGPTDACLDLVAESH